MTPSPIQLIIVLIIVLLLFGAKKIPELAKGLGTGMREFKQGASGEIEDDNKDSDSSESRVDKEASETPASESHEDVRSEDDSANDSAKSSNEAGKTEQRS